MGTSLIPLSSYGYAWNNLCDVIDGSSIFDSEHRQPHSRCMENTRVALLASITQILGQSDRTNIWLNGLAGVGKTSIAFTIAEKMKVAKKLAATFFFSHNQDATAVIPTIAYQLALAFPQIREDIVRAVETDRKLLSSEKSRDDQMRELVIIPLGRLEFRKEPYVIVIDALDECSSAEEAARLVTLLTRTLSGPHLPTIHLIFTCRPVMKIRENMPPGVLEIPLTTGDKDTIQDVHFFLRSSLDKIRINHPKLFNQPLIPWPSDNDFMALTVKAGGLFVYAALAMAFISATGHDPQDRLNLLLCERSTVSGDVDQLYRRIIASSENPELHCRILASIICLLEPLPLSSLQELFHADRRGLIMMLESFLPVILNPPNGGGVVRIYHASLRDFMKDPRRSGKYHVDHKHSNEELACYCIDFLIRQSPTASEPFFYAFTSWGYHFSRAYPSRRLRDLLALFTQGTMQYLMETSRFSYECLLEARNTCLSLRWMRSLSDIVLAWRIAKTLRKVEKLKARSREISKPSSSLEWGSEPYGVVLSNGIIDRRDLM